MPQEVLFSQTTSQRAYLFDISFINETSRRDINLRLCIARKHSKGSVEEAIGKMSFGVLELYEKAVIQVGVSIHAMHTWLFFSGKYGMSILSYSEGRRNPR